MIKRQIKSIAKSYDKIANEYVKKHGYGEQLSIPALKKFVSLLPGQGKILDVGCGGGQDSKFLSDKGYDVLGIDVSKEMVKLAKKYSPTTKFKTIDVMKLSASNKYSGIWCCRVFHHIPIKQQDNFLNKLNSLLKNKGILYITSVVSDNKKDYEAFDSGNDSLLKKRLTATSFKKMIGRHSFKILKLNFWVGNKGMELYARKLK